MTMTARERFWRTCQFKEPDRVPLQLAGNACSVANDSEGINNAYGYDAVCRSLGIDNYAEPVGDFGIKNLHIKIQDRCHNDFQYVDIVGPKRIQLPNYNINREERHQLWGFYTLRHDGLLSFSYNMFPFLNKTTIKDIEEYEFWPNPDDSVYYEGIKDFAKKLHDDTQYVIIGDTGCAAAIDFVYQNLRGFSNWLSDPFVFPDFYIALKNKIADISIEISKRFYIEIGALIDMISYYEDMGSQNSSFFSVDYYRKWIMPWQKKWNDTIKQVTKAKRWIHSCGSIYNLFPSMLEAGFEVINPIQPLAKNMEPWRLKKDFYGKAILHGGIDLQQLLRQDNIDEVVRGVKELIKILAPGGGWIAAGANNIPRDVPPENIFAAFDTIYKYGKYPINIS